MSYLVASSYAPMLVVDLKAPYQHHILASAAEVPERVSVRWRDKCERALRIQISKSRNIATKPGTSLISIDEEAHDNKK